MLAGRWWCFCCWRWWPSRRLRRGCVLLALIFVGAFTDAWHRPGARPTIDAGSRETVVLAGCVVEPSVLSPGRQQFTLELDRDARARVSLPLDDDVVPQRLEYGQRVEIEARVRVPRNFNNPGSFDYAGYLARQRIYWTAGMTRGSVARVLPGRCGWRAMAAIFALRGAALDRIERLYADSYTSGMMEAMLIGESSQLQKIWTENFRRTGTFHALVISGAHVAVLAGVLLFFLRICSLGEIPALALTAGAAWLYALVSGFSPPVARAAGGFTLYLIARFFFRRGRVLNLLAAVALVYLLSDPGEMGDASFQLSFLCVAALGRAGGSAAGGDYGAVCAGAAGDSGIRRWMRIWSRGWRSFGWRFGWWRRRSRLGCGCRRSGARRGWGWWCARGFLFMRWCWFRWRSRLGWRCRWRFTSIAFLLRG